jgi:tRNA(Ile)-lysidine synthase
LIDKAFLKNACDGIFLTKRGRDIENTISEFMSSNSMNELLARGVAVGFSGGADSVLLLIFLRKIQKELGFTLKAVHINHMIRGADADEDEAFSKEFAEALGIEFISKKIDVPSIAKSSKTGLEEAARNVRYQFLNEIVDSTHAIGAIATAHNATDNLETVIFNLMRGTGINGLCGIAPVRDNIIRPMLQIPKAEILELLNEAKGCMEDLRKTLEEADCDAEQ